MRTTIGSRKSFHLMPKWDLLTWGRWAFPPTEQDLKGGDQGNKSEHIEGSDATEEPDAVKAKGTTDDNEQVEGTGKAKKPGVVEAGKKTGSGASGNPSGSHATVDDLPEVPKVEPSTGNEPEPKRQKQ